MTPVDVDFEVFKALTAKRQTEAMTFNDVLRKLLDLGTQEQPKQAGRSFVYKGVEFPHGTKFRATYKGRTHLAEVKGGAWVDERGTSHTSPSAAATAITKNAVNGWTFWECKRPDAASWRSLKELR